MKEMELLLDERFSLSPFYRTYSFEVKVAEASPNIGEKKLSALVFGMGWRGVVVSTLYEKVLFAWPWQQVEALLGGQGIRIQSEKSFLVFRCPRVL